MKTIEIDEELYQYIASNTQFIGESASAILRRLLKLEEQKSVSAVVEEKEIIETGSEEVTEPEIINRVDTKEQGSVFDYINREELTMQRGAVGRFLLILAALYRVHKEEFSCVLNIRGRGRLYFARTEAELAESGSSTKPRAIPESPYWVITNSNTTRKKMMLTEAAISLGYDETDAEKIRELL